MEDEWQCQRWRNEWQEVDDDEVWMMTTMTEHRSALLHSSVVQHHQLHRREGKREGKGRAEDRDREESTGETDERRRGAQHSRVESHTTK